MTNNSYYNRTKVIKRTIKYLTVHPDSKEVRAVLQRKPEGVIRAVSKTRRLTHVILTCTFRRTISRLWQTISEVENPD